MTAFTAEEITRAAQRANLKAWDHAAPSVFVVDGKVAGRIAHAVTLKTGLLVEVVEHTENGSTGFVARIATFPPYNNPTPYIYF